MNDLWPVGHKPFICGGPIPNCHAGVTNQGTHERSFREMRNISFALATQQFKARTKTMTRRTGWRKLKVGDVLCGVEKGRGLKPGEKLVRLGPIKIVDVRREPLRRMIDDRDYGLAETAREGFPSGELHLPSEFVKWFCRMHEGCTPDSEVTRIEYSYLQQHGQQY